MAITVNHGNIASALGLAAQAGRADRNQRVASQDLQFLQLMQQAQQAADRDYANQIQTALNAQHVSNEEALQSSALQQRAADSRQTQADRDRQYALDAGKAGYVVERDAANREQRAGDNAASRDLRSQGLDIQQAHQDTRQQTADLRDEKYRTQQTAIDELDPTIQGQVRAGGRLHVNGDGDTRTLEAEYRRLQTDVAAATKRQKDYTVDPKSLIGPRSEESPTVPGSAKGYEARYQDAQRQIDSARKRMEELDQQLHQKTSGAAPATSAPRIVQTAVNASGQRVGFDANSGQWIPL
jgi:hypothetical protein